MTAQLKEDKKLIEWLETNPDDEDMVRKPREKANNKTWSGLTQRH